MENSQEKEAGLGNVIKMLRLAREMSTKDLATKMNVSSTYISEVEANTKRPSWEMLSRFSDALGVKKSTIVRFDEEREENQYNNQRLLLEILQKIIEI